MSKENFRKARIIVFSDGWIDYEGKKTDQSSRRESNLRTADNILSRMEDLLEIKSSSCDLNTKVKNIQPYYARKLSRKN